MEIKNLKKAAERILKAIRSKENIILYGDSDMDGISSVIILKESIENLGGKVKEVYFPDREEDGYGINKKAILFLKKYTPALLIVFDCGIGNFKEIDMANKIGFEVIVIDHHEILGKIPNASIIVDPKQPGDEYPFKQFAAVGLSFRLSEVLFGGKMAQSLRKSFSELAAMATIADMMPQEADNKKIIQEGLSSIRESWRPGIQALFKTESIEMEFQDKKKAKRGKTIIGFNYLPLIQQVEKINSLLNIPDVKNGLPAAFRLLTCSNVKEAEKLSKWLYEKSVQKKETIKKIVYFLEDEYYKYAKCPIIFSGNPNWGLILLGTVASILSQKYQKPVFLYKKKGEDSVGSVRSPSKFNVVEAMKKCSKVLITFGGHPQAAGFRIKNKDIREFKDCLTKYFKKM